MGQTSESSLLTWGGVSSFLTFCGSLLQAERFTISVDFYFAPVFCLPFLSEILILVVHGDPVTKHTERFSYLYPHGLQTYKVGETGTLYCRA